MDEEKSEVPSEQPSEQPAEQPVEQPPADSPGYDTPDHRQRKSAAPLVIVLILIIAVAVAAYVLVGRGKAWEPAAYMPQEVAIAVTIDVSGSADRDAAISFIRGVLKDAGTEFPEKDLFKEINKQLKLDVEKDVLPKLNGQGGFALLTEMSGMTPGVVLVVGAKSANDAKDLVKLVDGKVREQGEKTELKKYDAYDYYIISTGPMGPGTVCVGAVGDGVVCTMGETAFKTAVNTYKGKPSLLKNEHYSRLRESGSSTFATAFYSGPNLYKLIGPYMAMAAAQMGPDAGEQMKKGFESVVAVVGSAMATGDGLKLQVKAVSTEEGPQMAKASIDDLVRNVPANAAAAYVMPDVKTWWATAKKQLASSPGPMNPFTMIRERAQAVLGLDVYKDVLDNVKSFEGYYVPKGPLPKSKFAGYVGLALGVDKPALISKSLAKINAAVSESAAMEFKSLAVAGQKLAVGPLGKEGVKLADAVVRDKVLITITGSNVSKDAKAVIDASQGKGRNLASSERFKAVASQLPGESAGLLYADLGAIFEAYKSEMPAKDAKTALAITKKVGTIGMSGSISGKESEGYVVVPFMR